LIVALDRPLIRAASLIVIMIFPLIMVRHDLIMS